MKKQVMQRSAFFNPRGLIGLFIVSAGVFLALLGLGAFSSAFALTPVSGRNPVAKADTHVLRIDNPEIAPRSGSDPVVVNVTLITGPHTHVSGGSHPGVSIADLDRDHSVVAGSMRYVWQGFFLSNAITPFLWEEDRGATMFHVPDNDDLGARFFDACNGMTPDGSKIVGGRAFLDRPRSKPWVATRQRHGRVEFLEFPEDLGGVAKAISNDGRLVAGMLLGQGPSGFTLVQAVVWNDGALEMLSTQTRSEVGSQVEPNLPFPQHPMNSDGSLIVGASGPSFDQMQATRWVDGVEQPLSTGSFEAQSSVAMFVADNGFIFGTATASDGNVVIMRWDSDGNLQVLPAPNGFRVILTSVDRLGTAAGGAFKQRSSCDDEFVPCRQLPFVWTVDDGFTILPIPADDYVYPIVYDVSDNGRVAAGVFPSLVDPTRTFGFVWSAASGVVSINDLMVPWQDDQPFYQPSRISRDGNRVLVTGNPPHATLNDTASLILDLAWPGSAPELIGAASSKVHGTAGAFSVSLPLGRVNTN